MDGHAADLRGGSARAAGAPEGPGNAGRHTRAAVPVRRLAGFMGLPLISAIAPFLVLPVLLGHVGTAAWAGIAIGQSIGTGTSTLVQIGWPVVGPAVVAENPGRRRALYTQSLISRLTVFCAAAPVAMALSAALAPGTAKVAAALMALAMSMVGLSATWFFVGTGQPGLIARFDTIPRVAAAGAAALLLLWLPWAWLYPTCLLVSSSVLLVVVSAGRWERGQGPPVRTTLKVVRHQWAAAGVSVQAAFNTTLPMTLLAVVAPSVVPSFAALERVTKFAVFVLGPVGLAFQGWVSEPSRAPEHRRRTAFRITVGAGLVLATGFLLGAHVVLRILFAGKIEVPLQAVVFASVSILCVAGGTTLGFHHLVPLGMSSWLAVSTAMSLVVGSVAMVVLAPHFGVSGAALAVMAAEVCVCGTQVFALARRRRRVRATATVHDPTG